MSEIFKTQFAIFMFSCILGIILGIIYDCFRIVRMMINPRNIFIFFQDIVYFLLSALITFLFVLMFNDGESRFYILAGEGIGWIVYHITFGEWVYRCSEKMAINFKSCMKKIIVKFKLSMSKIHKIISLKFLKK